MHIHTFTATHSCITSSTRCCRPAMHSGQVIVTPIDSNSERNALVDTPDHKNKQCLVFSPGTAGAFLTRQHIPNKLRHGKCPRPRALLSRLLAAPRRWRMGGWGLEQDISEGREPILMEKEEPFEIQRSHLLRSDVWQPCEVIRKQTRRDGYTELLKLVVRRDGVRVQREERCERKDHFVHRRTRGGVSFDGHAVQHGECFKGRLDRLEGWEILRTRQAIYGVQDDVDNFRSEGYADSVEGRGDGLRCLRSGEGRDNHRIGLGWNEGAHVVGGDGEKALAMGVEVDSISGGKHDIRGRAVEG